MHESVLLNESIEGLNIKKEGIYIDATLGYGGHSSEILTKLNEKGFLFAFDQDKEAIKYSEKRLLKIKNNFKLIHSNFVDMNKYIKTEVDGILFDLGVSSPQLDISDRGFSFHEDGPLDMRMNKENELTAFKVVNEYSERNLSEIIYKYAENKYAKNIAKNIVKARPINSTLELSEIIKGSVPLSERLKHHPARSVFQAIRIEVNKELEILESSLIDAFNLLKVGGRLCVITFHPGEDRIVKSVFKKLSTPDIVSQKLPIIPDNMKEKGILINRNVIIPCKEEIDKNIRSRTSKLRIIERIRK